MSIRLNTNPNDRPLSMRARIIIGVIVTALLLALALTGSDRPSGGVIGMGVAGADEPGTITTTNTPDGECHEDMPCWDCHTMGNRICGPDVTLIPPLVIDAPPADPVVAPATFTG